MLPLLQIKELDIFFEQHDKKIAAVNKISFDLAASKITAIIGESGSGKSVTALSFMQLLAKNATVHGRILYSENNTAVVDILSLKAEERRKMRGKSIAMIFQEPMTSLNPVHTCGAQVIEALMLHKKLSKKKAKEETIALFTQVELPFPAKMIDRYPHEISGGQKQRVMIAMAISCNPVLLIADEPTTALDVRVQKNILLLLKKLQQDTGMAILLITHDLQLVADVADEIIVMYKGDIVEKGNAATVLKYPQHNYTKALLACKPNPLSKGKKLPVVSEIMEGEYEKIILQENKNILKAGNSVLSVENLCVYYPSSKNIFGKITGHFKAVDTVSFNIKQNETVGLVGESGCGKTTLGRAILHLIKPTSGKIIFGEKNINDFSPAALRLLRKDMQIVFQDPYGSLNPRMNIGDAIMEPLQVHEPALSKNNRREKAVQLLKEVSINAEALHRYPHHFSGGQRQRICIARALALNPSFLIFDESVSALDVSVQAQVLNLINHLKNTYQFTAIFISHDLAVVHYISDRIMVMNKGKIIEEGIADDIFFNPKQDYTKELIAAIPGNKPFF